MLTVWGHLKEKSNAAWLSNNRHWHLRTPFFFFILSSTVIANVPPVMIHFNIICDCVRVSSLWTSNSLTFTGTFFTVTWPFQYPFKLTRTHRHVSTLFHSSTLSSFCTFTDAIGKKASQIHITDDMCTFYLHSVQSFSLCFSLSFFLTYSRQSFGSWHLFHLQNKFYSLSLSLSLSPSMTGSVKEVSTAQVVVNKCMKHHTAIPSTMLIVTLVLFQCVCVSVVKVEWYMHKYSTVSACVLPFFTFNYKQWTLPHYSV